MMSKANAHRQKLTDEQIRERIGRMMCQPQKTSNLTFAIFAVSVLALLLYFFMRLTSTGGYSALILWTINLVWALIAAVGWKTLPLERLKQLTKQQQHAHMGSETIWFHLWKGGYLTVVSAIFLLSGLALLAYAGARTWARALAVSAYLLCFVISFLQRRRIRLVLVRGWSRDSRWGRWMLRLAVIGPAAGASWGAAVAILLVRLEILPLGIAAASLGLMGILIAMIPVPQVVMDWSVAWIHLEMRRAEADQAAEKG
jgi:hypothetical protein